ncbi:MAG: fibronectin type III domain-containing protein [Phycisphaeraceae bacterium]|nr:fibronectin type III domain-containing protein [Phycisphaeraceae bacterium]
MKGNQAAMRLNLLVLSLPGRVASGLLVPAQTAFAQPSPLTLVSPGTGNGPGETIGTLTPTMRWNASQGATGYGLYISRNDGGGWTLIYDNDNVANTTSLVLPSGYLQAGKQYRWNMRAKNGSGWSGFSTHLYFQTQGSAPPPPTLVSFDGHAPGERRSTLTPTMRWNTLQCRRYGPEHLRNDVGAAGLIYDNDNGGEY